jgi:hypothetical protein
VAKRQRKSKTIARALEKAAQPTKKSPATSGSGVPQQDDTRVMALELPAGTLSPAMQAYFAKCQEKLGFVPNVLAAYAFDPVKLEAFVAMYNDLMLGPSGLS